MGKVTAPDVLENFEAAGEGLNKNKFIQLLSDGPNVNFKLLELLTETRKDDGLNDLISIGTCSLHTVNRAFQNAENSTMRNIKKLLCALYNIFNESPSRRADYERILSATKEDYPLFFLLHLLGRGRQIALKIWLKFVGIVKYWCTLPKNKQTGRGDPK